VGPKCTPEIVSSNVGAVKAPLDPPSLPSVAPVGKQPPQKIAIQAAV
jgi:hypothetical protein